MSAPSPSSEGREPPGLDAPLLLVPTDRYLDHELAARLGVAGRTLHDFTAAGAAYAAPDLAPATVHATRLLAREALAALPPERLRFPAEPAARVGLAHAVDRSLGALRAAGTTPDHLRAAGTKSGALLADILDAVDGGLARAGLHDPRGAARLAAIAAGAGWLDGMTRVTVVARPAWEPEDLALLEAVHVALRGQGGLGLTLELPRLEGPAALLGAPSGSNAAAGLGDAIAPIADAIERRWASLPDAPEIAWRAESGGTPELVVTARDADGEARAVVARVLGALGEGTPPERIAIVVPDLEEARLEPLRALLGDARVSFVEPRGRTVPSCAEGRVALGLLAMAAGPVSRDQAIELLRAPGVHTSAWLERAPAGEAARRAVTLAHRLREVPVEIDRSGRLFVEAITEATRERPDEAWMPRALERMLKEVRWVSASDARAAGTRAAEGARAAEDTGEGGDAPRHELARRLSTVIDRVGLGRPTLRELGDALLRETSPGDTTGSLSLRALGDSAAAVRGLREALRGIVEGAASVGLSTRAVAAAELAAELASAAGELGIGVGTAGGGAVRIARPGDLVGLPFDLVVVTGLGARGYGGGLGETAFLDERTRARLPAACRPPSSHEREAWRRAELAWVIAGSRRVIVSQVAGGDGELATPHELARWAKDHGARTWKEPVSRLAAGASRTDERGVALAALAAGAPARGEVGERVAIERTRTAFFLDPRTAAGEHTGRVTLADEPARRRLIAAVGGDAPDRPVAVTAIERAAACAFAGFARRVLRLRRVDDLGEAADHRERGTLVHRALHAAFEGARGATTRADALARGRVTAERELGLAAPMAPLRREAVTSAVGDALEALSLSLEPGQPLRFLAGEQRFGPRYVRAARAVRRRASPGALATASWIFDATTATPPTPEAAEGAPWPSLAIPGDDPGAPVLYVDGQIDRVDVSRDGRRARVVDYKTGRLPAAEDHGRRAFQLQLYAAVAAAALGCEDVEAQYVALRPRGAVEEWPRSDDDRRALGAGRHATAEAARRVVMRMWDGDAAPRPASAATCTRCEARDACRRPAVAPIEEPDER